MCIGKVNNHQKKWNSRKVKNNNKDTGSGNVNNNVTEESTRIKNGNNA